MECNEVRRSGNGSAFGIELNPAYVDVAVERWQQFTGETAVLDGTGETLAELKARRLVA